jgi:hypothetical protein
MKNQEKWGTSCAVVCKKLRTWLEANNDVGYRAFTREKKKVTAQLLAHFKK